METRQNYLNGKVSHKDYYGQFVDETMKNEVKRSIGMEDLIKSKDEHLNDIPLAKWDALAGFLFRGSTMVMSPKSIKKELSDKFKSAGEGLSCATMVCIYKEAARQLIADNKV